MNQHKVFLLAITLLFLLLVAGCMMPGGRPTAGADLTGMQGDLEKIDHLTSDEAVKLDKQELETALEKAPEKSPLRVRNPFLIAYCAERLANYQEAINRYETLGRTPYRGLAYFRIGEIASHASGIMEADKTALSGYTRASGYYPVGKMLVRDPALASASLKQWKMEDLRVAANSRADHYQRRNFSYKAIDALVAFTGRTPSFSYGFALFLIALIVKVVTIPLSTRQFKSMKEMQALQPLITELQKKYKNDREALMKEQMRLFKEHKINPLGGCLPMLIQLPFLIWVWRAVWAYNWQFEHKPFLWIANLAAPNTLLLILYAISLYLSQKLTVTPTADPQQQQMQRMMAILFPVMFLMMFQSMPSAFILYWFSQNVLMTAHQYYIMKKGPQPAFVETPPTKTVKRR